MITSSPQLFDRQAADGRPSPAPGDNAHARAAEAFARRSTDGETILIVDDAPENLSVLGDLLEDAGYRVKVANGGQVALRLAELSPRPSLILLDVMMPYADGYEVLRELRCRPLTQDIPVVFLTAMDSPEDEERAFHAGIVDYITKPIKPAVVLARVRNQLLVRQARHWLQDQNQALEAEVARRMRENEQIQVMSIRALAHLAETRDNETGFHIQRTQDYVRELATRLKEHPRFCATLTPKYIDLLSLSAPLHDIGKVGIPDHILLKPGKLTPEEWVIMRTHTVLGSDAIDFAQTDVDAAIDFLTQAKEIARWHHERWDGGGYPDGLKGDAIPLSARLMALADVFDALISRRCYKPAIGFDRVYEIIRASSGSHFDPDVASAFLDNYEVFKAIALEHGLDT